MTRVSLSALTERQFYEENKPFTCLDGSRTIPFDRVNDDYCDCHDGSDEPGVCQMRCHTSIWTCSRQSWPLLTVTIVCAVIFPLQELLRVPKATSTAPMLASDRCSSLPPASMMEYAVRPWRRFFPPSLLSERDSFSCLCFNVQTAVTQLTNTTAAQLVRTRAGSHVLHFVLYVASLYFMFQINFMSSAFL